MIIDNKKRYNIILIIISITLIIISSIYYFILKKPNNLPDNPSNILKPQPSKICIKNLYQAEELKEKLNSKLTNEEIITNPNTEENCKLTITQNPENSDLYRKFHTQTYIAITQHTTPINEINDFELEKALKEKNYKGVNLIWSPEINNSLTSKFNIGLGFENANIESTIEKIENSSKILDKSEQTIVIIPIDKLNSKMKLININDTNPFLKSFNSETYPLTLNYWIKGKDSDIKAYQKHIKEILPHDDNTQKFTITATGNSKIGAGLQNNISNSNVLRGISNYLNHTDYILINNESPITQNCEFYNLPTKYLCGKPSSITELADNYPIIVNIAGYHIFDFGKNAYIESIETYNKANIKYFAGGQNKEEAYTPISIEIGNNKIAFLGYNLNPVYKGYNARSESPGNAGTDQIIESIEEAQKNNNFIITTVHQSAKDSNAIENYNLQPTRSIIENGKSDLIISVSPSIIKGVEYYNNKLIFYGLGNFLTDYISNRESQEAVILELYFKGEELISYKLIPILIEKDGRITVAETKDSEIILNKIYKNSILWK